MTEAYKKTKFITFYTYLAMGSVFSLPPILFLTFNEMYGISYTLLGTLVLVNFVTQLTIDLILSFFGKYFNPHTLLKVAPMMTGVGLLTYALTPMLFPEAAYAGLVVGTVIFSIAAGMGEVLLSPTVAALPSDNPERDMSTLHSLYGYGVVLVVGVSTVFLKIFGNENWMFLAILWAIFPVIASILMCTATLPVMDLSHAPIEKGAVSRSGAMVLCFLCIFFGSAAENAMTNWVSTYIEGALCIDKAVGDILGLMLFAVLLALTRTWYAKYGKNIYKMLLVSMAASILCYLVAGLSLTPVISMIACVMTGIFTSMLWPGTLILMEEKIPNPGVAAYALMAAGGDFGAAVAPQSLGAIVDAVAESAWGKAISSELSLSPEQLGLKIGMIAVTVFPVIGVCVLLYMKKYFKKHAM